MKTNQKIYLWAQICHSKKNIELMPVWGGRTDSFRSLEYAASLLSAIDPACTCRINKCYYPKCTLFDPILLIPVHTLKPVNVFYLDWNIIIDDNKKFSYITKWHR